ncbi:hypothetical protein Dimus_037962 [Dionaea muscipula]
MEGSYLTFPLKNTLTTTIVRQKNSSHPYLKHVNPKIAQNQAALHHQSHDLLHLHQTKLISTRSYLHHGRMPKPLPMTHDAPSSQGEDEGQSPAKTGTRPTSKLD